MSSSRHQSRNLVLPSPARGESVVTRYAGSKGWEKISEIPEDQVAGTLRKVVWEIDPGVGLHFSVDDATGLAYLYVSANSPEDAGSRADQIANVLGAREYAELLDGFDNAKDNDERAGALLTLALGALPGPDTASVDRISTALTDADPGVREAAIYASSYRPTDRYRPLLRQIAEHDPVDQLREDAREMLDIYDEIGIG